MTLTCTAARSGRLSSFLRQELAMSAGLMNRLKWQQMLFVNGAPVHTDYPVVPGDVITVPLDEPEPDYPAQDGPLSVLYEDEGLLALDKPAGILIHPSTHRIEGTLANFTAGYYRRTGQKCAFHPVTRLDRDTFGVVLLAKNSYLHEAMNALHRQGQLEKCYHARVFGGPPSDSGTVDAPIARKPLPSLLREVRADGKPCRTEYRVLERDGETALLALRPVTGRTHQLRIHCAWLGCPILGDPQYGTPASTAYSLARGLTGQRLCAVSLTFPHPLTGEKVCIRSNLTP